MFFRQFFDKPLAQASYMIGCQETGEAIVIDPTRDADQYVRAAKSEDLRIILVTETHIHADFVSGSRELGARTGAQMLLSGEGGSNWQYDFASADNARLLLAGESFMLGNIRFDVLHTPGHTPEHLSFVVTDTPAAAGPMGIVTGDFVFVGDVGRPDLLEKAAHVAGTMESSARVLYHSLQKFRELPDHLQLWPGHGAGSACGKALGAVPFSTVGYEKLANWALNVHHEDVFVRLVLDGQLDPPTYFASMKRINKEGPRVLNGMPMPPKLPPVAIHGLMSANAFVLDVRHKSSFAAAHVPNTLSIPYNRSFTGWAGWLIPTGTEVTLLVNADDNAPHSVDVERAVHDLALIGLDRINGWLDQRALKAWTDAGGELGRVPQVTVQELRAMNESAHIVDVRRADEWQQGHIPQAQNLPLGHLADRLDALPDGPLVVHCQTGSRSSIAASLLMRAGYRNVSNLVGGIKAWQQNSQPLERE